jgi:cytochrome c oxidase cbb3-type subunit 3
MAERDELRDHQFDGIQEYDNDLPRWWLGIFYACILTAIVYVVWFHFGPGRVGPLAHEREVAHAKSEAAAREAAAGPMTEEQLRAIVADVGRAELGRKAWEKINCASCHGSEALGNTGPNLRDDHWRYGSNMLDIYTTLLNGRQSERGQMPAQRAFLSRSELMNLTVYLVQQNVAQKANGQGLALTDADKLAPITYYQAAAPKP